MCRGCCSGGSDDIEYLKNMRILSKIDYSNMDKVNMNNIYAYKYIKETISLIENKIGI